MLPNLTAQIEGIEWIIVLIVIGVALFFGGRKVADWARASGKLPSEYQKGRLEGQMELDEMKAQLQAKKQAQETPPTK